MAIEFSCNQCGKTLRVPDEHLGKKARCPSCQAICLIETTTPDAHSNLADPLNSIDSSTTPYVSVADKPGSIPNNPYASSMSEDHAQHGYGRRAYMAPHRGALVLTLGIISLIMNCFLIPGILAWVFGSSDLKQMKAGMMDLDGKSLTQVGMILGIIGTLLPLAFALVYVLFVVIVIIIGIVGAAAGA